MQRTKIFKVNVLYGTCCNSSKWSIAVGRYSAGVADWTRGHLSQIDVKTRKILISNWILHPTAKLATLYLGRRTGGKGIISVEDYVLSGCKGL